MAIDEPEDLAELQKELGEAVTLLADPDGQAVSAFDMIDPDPFPDRVQARAGTFWIDRDGKLRHRWLTDSYRERPDPEEILAKIRSGL
jgi:peroxiredoxin